ncbi:MAG: M28 family peptidase [Candidatus Latescibacter sp.]|nr:M28 family peptidase [Candidatus Latescibacter sp.]
MRRRHFMQTALALPLAAGCSAMKPSLHGPGLVDTPEKRQTYLSKMLKALVTDLGPHPIGSPQFDKALAIVKKELESAGFTTTLDTIEFSQWVLRTKVDLTVGGKAVEACPSPGTRGTSPEGLTGTLKKNASATIPYYLIDSAGNTIAIVTIAPKGKACPRSWMTYDKEPGGITNVCVGKQDVSILEAAVSEKTPVHLHYIVDYIPGKKTSNLIGTLPGESPDQIVYYAHLDTTYNAPGANDNTSSVIMLLMIAHALSGTRPKKTVRIMATTGEEYAWLGVKHLAQTWKADGTLQKIKFIACFDGVSWGPDMSIITKDKELMDILLAITKDLHLKGTPEWRNGSDSGRETRPLRDAGLTARGLVCDSVPDSDMNAITWHRPEDVAATVRFEPVEIAFQLFKEFLNRIQNM